MGGNWAARGEANWGTVATRLLGVKPTGVRVATGLLGVKPTGLWVTIGLLRVKPFGVRVATGLLGVKPTGVWLETVANWAARSEAVRGTVATALSGWHATGEGWQLDFRVEINFKGGTVRADDVTYSPRD